MVYFKKDFSILNISNVPVTEDKIRILLSIFINNAFSYEDLIKGEMYERLDYSKETFRKVINHSTILGILDVKENRYGLTQLSKEYYFGNMSFEKYLSQLIKENKEIYQVVKIIITLLKFFSSSLRSKTLYLVFSFVSKGRVDQSSQASVGRNLRAYLSLLNMLGIVKKNKDRVYLTEEKIDFLFDIDTINPINKQFTENIINVRSLSQYLFNFFDPLILPDILSCISTYEFENYIWTKSSLYKNQGEIRNLHGEYIMTVIIKDRMG